MTTHVRPEGRRSRGVRRVLLATVFLGLLLGPSRSTEDGSPGWNRLCSTQGRTRLPSAGAPADAPVPPPAAGGTADAAPTSSGPTSSGPTGSGPTGSGPPAPVPPGPPVRGERAVDVVPGMPPAINPTSLYSEAVAGRFSPAVAGALELAYVPEVGADIVDVIDTHTLKIVNRFYVGLNPQHVVPSWDLKTLWVVSNAERTNKGSVTPIDPKTGRPGQSIWVDDPYNMYFSPDGQSAIVVAEAERRLDFRDPHTMTPQWSLPTPGCDGINHADFAVDGRYAIFTCEFAGSLAKIDLVDHKVVGYLKLSKGGMPQDIRLAPDGKTFYVADMMADGVFLIDGAAFTEVGFIPTGTGTHGLYPSRDGTKLYVSNRGSNRVHGGKHGKGSVSVIDFATNTVEANWPIPGGGSPDMGNVSADGKQLWLSGRFDNVVYVIDTQTGSVVTIPVGREPHGLAVWPQPGRYSLGHTGIMR